MRERLHTNHPEVMETHRHLQKLHREIREEMGKDSPDRKLLEHKLHEVREGVELLEKSMHAAFLDTVLALPAPERRRILDEMRRQGPPPPPRPDAPPRSDAEGVGRSPQATLPPPEDDGVPTE